MVYKIIVKILVPVDLVWVTFPTSRTITPLSLLSQRSQP